MTTNRRGFGALRKLPSGRWQASYTGPDQQRHAAPDTFREKIDAEGWLFARRKEIDSGTWVDIHTPKPAVKVVTIAGYANTWLADRPIKPRTKALYRSLLDRLILQPLGDMPVADLTPAAVRAWHADLDATKPTQRAHAYALLKAIMATAVVDELRHDNPCRIVAAGQTKRARQVEPATIAEINTIAANMPEQYNLLVLLAGWCAMRFGELAELRRSDVDVKNGVIKIRRAVVRVNGKIHVGTPKSDAGIRDVNIPPHLMPAVKAHMARGVFGRDALLFPGFGGEHLHPTTLYRHYDPAKAAAGREDLRFHDLRHSGAVLAAKTGATLKELMARLGHSTPGAALRYQHAAQGRDAEIAAALSAMMAAQ